MNERGKPHIRGLFWRRIVHNPYIVILFTFLVLIVCGGFLLSTPLANNDGKWFSIEKSLFTATTSVCVTGLTLVDDFSAQFNIFGLIVIAVLIAIGGLTIITFIFALKILFRREFSYRQLYLMRETINSDNANNARHNIKWFVIIDAGITSTFAFYFVGYFMIKHGYSFGNSLGYAFFHSISSFNNAGIQIFGDGAAFQALSSDLFFSIPTMLLIVLGGIGFVVLFDLPSILFHRRLSIHTKTVLLLTATLLVLGFAGIKISGGSEITWDQALFMSVSARTAGFSAVNMSSLRTPAILTLIFLMFIGASPCSTGGGIKTTTMHIVLVTIASNVLGIDIPIGKRVIDPRKKTKAFMILALSVFIVCLFLLIVGFIEGIWGRANALTLEQIFFEVVSAYGTAGLSLDATSLFTPASKFFICLLMLIGRVGGLTIFSIFNDRWLSDQETPTSYASGNIFIG